MVGLISYVQRVIDYFDTGWDVYRRPMGTAALTNKSTAPPYRLWDGERRRASAAD